MPNPTSICIYFKFQFIHYFCATLGFIEAINELIEYSGSLYKYWLIIFDSFVYRHAHKRFWLLIQQIEMDVYPRGTFTFFCYKVKFIEFFAASTAGIIYKLVVSVKSSYFVYIIPFRICQIRIFYYIFCLETIQLQLKQIEHELNRAYSLNSIGNERPKLKQILKNFEHVYETAKLLNMIFGWSHVAAVLFCFFSISTDLNYLYLHLNEITVLGTIGKFHVFIKT